MRLPRFASLLTRRAESQLVHTLTKQLDVALEAAQLSQSVVEGSIDLGKAHEKMSAVEHRGDVKRAELVETLSRALASPIDREDLFRLSRSIDDIVDTLRDFVRESHLYRVGDQTRLSPAIADVTEGIMELREAVEALLGNASMVTEHALSARKSGGAVCRKYQYEIAYLFNEEMSATAMKSRELARRLDIAGSRICEAADAVADGAMKRWH